MNSIFKLITNQQIPETAYAYEVLCAPLRKLK